MSTFEQQLMERLEDYALRIIAVYSALPDHPITGYQVAQVLGKQLLRSGTAVGANYAEAIRSHSLADKAAKQQICAKELEETAYWLRLLSKTGLLATSRLEPLLAETSELTAIFIASVRKLQQGLRYARIGYQLSAIGYDQPSTAINTHPPAHVGAPDPHSSETQDRVAAPGSWRSGYRA